MSFKLHEKNIMIDLETADSKCTSAILSIGAVKFNADGIYDEFYTNVDLQSCIDAGLTVGGATFEWWMRQSFEAKKALFAMPIDLEEALLSFSEWAESSEYCIWGNGSDFDNVILANAFDTCGLPLPWKFYNNRCYRTVKKILNSEVPASVGIKHNALADAKTQAIHLIDIARGSY